ncbi:MAG: DeoR/GlpR family DNA-binding transcription regulator [Planctomycetota bacterium]|nr:DeoR/GlpR family DNA-binding transcription regulator [Planctomycetota bacterium]RLT15961.1 MAG: DeoR/GlpR transcriptional regulator [Planctomycetota bacterium]
MNSQTSVNTSMARRARMLDVIRQQGFVSIPELRDSLEVSESTIRRDLESLEESGEARRTHGGVFYTGSVTTVRQFQRGNPNDGAWDKKRAIALEAAKLVSDHDTVLLDGGSTTYELAKQLVGRPLQIVTNSLPVANLFSASDSVDLVILGGAIHNRTGVTHGPFTDQMLETINVQKAFLSVAGVNEKGFYNSNLLLVETERCMMRSADRTIIVADSTKFGRSSLARMLEWNQVDTLVVDEDLSTLWRDRIDELDTNLILAPLNNSQDTHSNSIS